MDDILDRACSAAGGLAKLAAAISQSPQTVSNWRMRGVPLLHCVTIERATDGRVPVEQLRPDVRWVRIPDPAWPHPDGRPCIDVAAPAAREAA